MNSTFYIVSMEMFRIYKLFSASCRCNTRYLTLEEARNFVYKLCEDIKPTCENIYIESSNDNKIILYVDDGNEKRALDTIFTINICESISENKSAFMYRGHMIELIDGSWLISLEDGPIIGFETLDACLDFIDYSMVTRDNIIRLQGNYMMSTPLFNKGKLLS